MPRISRKCTESKYYHVMVQGINKEYIFEDKVMKNKYKKLLFEKANQNEILIYAYCIMDNHVHILIKTQNNEALSKMMLQINSSYGKIYNKNMNRVGYVFRDRYRAEPIFNNNHMQNCVRYIHENPVKACIVSECNEYEYSSFNEYQKRKINRKIIEDIYGEAEDYILKISGDYENYNFIEVENEFGKQILEDFETICKEYKNVDFNNEKNVFEVSNELKKRSNVTNEQIMQFMGIKRATYYRITRRQRE